MLANKPVLPNFLKTLSIALFTLSTISAYADGHGDHKKIGDLKEMTSDAGAQAEEGLILTRPLKNLCRTPKKRQPEKLLKPKKA